MSTATFAPPMVIVGPPPVAPRFNVFTVSEEIGSDDPHVLGGIQFYGYPPGAPDGMDPCATGTFRTKEEGVDAPAPAFATFTAYIAERCTMGGISGWDEFTERAEATMRATAGHAAERQLVAGSYVSTNPYLGDLSADILAAGASVPVGVGLSYLEDAIAATGRRGVIHATPAIASAWDSRVMAVGDQLQTNLGTPVVSGHGYVANVDDANTLAPENGSAPGAGESWAYATGPLRHKFGPVEPIGATVAQTLSREDNDLVFRAEMDIVIGWDTALQAAVLIDWTS